ncbi:MAG: glycosyltransferase family 2 protein [Acidimicrobiales bacterium]
MPTRVSFVVVNWREAEATATCVESVKAQEADAEVEIIVVDNESTLASRTRLESIAGIVLLAHSDNRGFTGGMNAGFAVATGDYFAAINNDLILGPDWLAAGLAQLADPSVGIVGGTEFLWDECNPPGDTSNEFHSQMFIDADSGYSYRTDEPINTRDVYALDGNNMLMPRHVAEVLGGFDDDFYMYYEDADLCARALALNYRIRFCADMHVWHRRNLSSNRIPYRRQFLAQRNHLVFVARHFPSGSWLRTVRRLSLQYLLFGAIGREAGVRRWRSAPRVSAASRRAHLASGLWGLSHRSYLVAKRRQLSGNGQRSDSYVDRLPTRSVPL